MRQRSSALIAVASTTTYLERVVEADAHKVLLHLKKSAQACGHLLAVGRFVGLRAASAHSM